MELATSTCLYPARRGGEAVTLKESLALCRDAGFRVIDANFCNGSKPASICPLCSDNWESEIYDLKNEAEKLGIRFNQSHLPYNSYLWSPEAMRNTELRDWYFEAVRRGIIATAMLGASWAVSHAQTDMLRGEWDFDQNMKTNIEFYKPQIELAAKHNTGIAIENMTEFDPVKIKRRFSAAVEELIAIIDALNDPAAGACWDFGHAEMMYKNQVPKLRKLGKRLKTTHVQENSGKSDAHLIPFVGGKTNWEELMPLLKEIGYEGDFTYECHGFMGKIPDALRPSAAKLVYEFGMYCVGLYNNA